MIAAVSLMRRSDAVSLATFRRHWLDVHGPLVCRFPGLRDYVQHHVIASPAINAAGRKMNIDGFPILLFANEADRKGAHGSPEMAACNDDSRLFIGAVSRVICEQHVVIPQVGENRVKLIALLPGAVGDDMALDRYADWACVLPRLAGLVLYRVLEQGPAPNSTIPHLSVSVAGLAALSFPSLVDLECAMPTDATSAAHFVVEEHRLV
jgi:uncharacterized protein (TIGR02118 family)